MKKLLYTLFAFAIIVACEKDMDDNYSVDSVSPIEASIEDTDISFLEVLANLPVEDRDYQAPKGIKGSPSTARSTDGTCGDDRDLTQNIVTITYFYTGADRATGSHYVFARDERSSPVVIDPAKVTSELIYVKTSATTINVVNPLRNNRTNALPTPPQALLDVFEDDYNVLYSTSATRVLGRLNRGARRAGLNIDCTVTVPTTDITDFFTLSAAPFPLTGVLATMNSGYETMTGWPGGTSANYAGTTTATVMTAISDDINDRR